MAENSDIDRLQRQGELTDQAHEKYRSTGIALTLSLAAASGSECWWLYRPELVNIYSPGWSIAQRLTWFSTIGTALGIFVGAFIIQFVNYFGMMHRARGQDASGMVHAMIEFARGKSPGNELTTINETLKREALRGISERTKANPFFDRADTCVVVIAVLAPVNAILFLLYVLIYQPVKA